MHLPAQHLSPRTIFHNLSFLWLQVYLYLLRIGMPNSCDWLLWWNYHTRIQYFDDLWSYVTQDWSLPNLILIPRNKNIKDGCFAKKFVKLSVMAMKCIFSGLAPVHQFGNSYYNIPQILMFYMELWLIRGCFSHALASVAIIAGRCRNIACTSLTHSTA